MNLADVASSGDDKPAETTDLRRRTMLAGLAAGGSVLAGLSFAGSSLDTNAVDAGCLNAKADFNAKGDGVADDSHPLQSAIDAGSGSHRPIVLPVGVYRITRPLNCPANTMLIGSSPGLGFGCRIEPTECAAFTIGGKTPSFHCSIQNIMIWPKGNAPDCLISIDNSYSITFRNIRIHDSQSGLKRAAVLLLGDSSSGGHGQSLNIVWENLIIRNDSTQPGVAIFAAKGCGSHRFYSPDLENFGVLLEWQGGQIDMIAPYTERAGRYAVNCNIGEDDLSSYLNTFGGTIDSAKSGVACAIRASTKNFNSFGTVWGATAERAAHVYSVPTRPIGFHGIVPNLTDTGTSRFSGVKGWRRAVIFSQKVLAASVSVEVDLPPKGKHEVNVNVPGVTVGEFWARAVFTGDQLGAQLNAYVSAADTVTIVAQNPRANPIRLKGLFCVEYGTA